MIGSSSTSTPWYDDRVCIPLSAREVDVLDLVAQGYSNIGIARQLCLSERTVEAHLTQVFRKFGLDEEPALNRRVSAVLLYSTSRTSGLASAAAAYASAV